MKRLLQLFVVAGMLAFVACGPSAEEMAEKAKQDSIRMADSTKRATDSIAEIQAKEKVKADSLAKVAEEQRKADSIKAAGEKKGKKK